MKILLVAPYTAMSAVYNNYLTSLGVLSLGTVLKAQAYDVEIVDFNSIFMNDAMAKSTDYERSLQRMVRHILDKQPAIVGFNTLCASLQDVLQITLFLKAANPAMKIIIGGPQSLHLPERLLEAFPWLDVVCVGEGESIIVDLVQGLAEGSLTKVPGIVYRDRQQVIRNPDAALVADLDTLPVVDYSLVPYVPHTRITMEIGRGCPYQCIYCSTSRYWRRKFRVKSLSRIRREIEGIKQYVPANEKITISFVDDNFTTNRRFALELCQLLAKMAINWDCSARLDTLDEEIISAMSRAGCLAIFMGIETGSPRLQKYINKNLDLRRFDTIADTILRYKMQPVSSFMYGFPSETKAELQQTLHLISSLLRKGASRCGLHALCIIGGTKMYDEHKERLVLREQCSNIVDTMGLEHCQELLNGNKDLFPHIYTLAESLSEQYLYLEKFVNLVVMSMYTVFPASVLAILDIFADDLLAFYEDFMTTGDQFATMLNSYNYTKLAMSKPEIFKYTLKCYFSYIATKAIADFRFGLIKHQLWQEKEKIVTGDYRE